MTRVNVAEIRRYPVKTMRFDVPPLLVATDGASAVFGHDPRRLRPNIVIGGVDGLSEREWPGACLRGSGRAARVVGPCR